MTPTNQYVDKLAKRNPELYKYFLRGIEILELLNSKMYEAYFVGGVVRDYLLGVDFKDIDIATAATPKEVLDLFPEGDGRFSELGCVEIREGNMLFQITTFRDEKLVTTRKTKNIHYSKKLIDDVLRRDFTINGLALSSNLNVIDIIGGQKDLKKGVIQVIGKPKVRFKEDPLRMLRGIELMARYNFVLSGSTTRGMKKCRKYIPDISQMKLSEMLLKIMNGKYAKNALYQMANIDLFSSDAVYAKWLLGICRKYKKTNVTEKLALLYYMYGSIPKNTCYSHQQLQEMEKLIMMAKVLDKQPIDGMMLYKYGSPIVLSANYMLASMGGKYKDKARFIKKLDKRLPLHDRRDFRFTAEELIQMLDGTTGPKITEIMELLIDKVIRGEILNNNTIIRQEAMRIIALENLDNPTEKPNPEPQQPVKQPSTPVQEPQVAVTPRVEVVVDVEQIKAKYAEEYKSLYASYMRSVQGYQSMSDEEKQEVSRSVKNRVRNELLSKNANYNILVERGII